MKNILVFLTLAICVIILGYMFSQCHTAKRMSTHITYTSASGKVYTESHIPGR